jgi:hypothetical protein
MPTQKSFNGQSGQMHFWQLGFSYLGFTLTPEGIKVAKPPTTLKMVRSFVGLCNFFWTHIKDFTVNAVPLFKVTRKDSGYKSGPLPPDALHAFKILQQQLTSDPVVAFPRADHQYALITDAATGTYSRRSWCNPYSN